jgi:hypothetical protein
VSYSILFKKFHCYGQLYHIFNTLWVLEFKREFIVFIIVSVKVFSTFFLKNIDFIYFISDLILFYEIIISLDYSCANYRMICHKCFSLNHCVHESLRICYFFILRKYFDPLLKIYFFIYNFYSSTIRIILILSISHIDLGKTSLS